MHCRVVEFITSAHEEDRCSPDCVQEHAYCFVRVHPSRSTAPRARWARRRLDLAVDLQASMRCNDLEMLLEMGDEELAEAWLLLEPRDDGGEHSE